MLTAVTTFCAFILGAMWRRWFGSAEGSGHGMRFVKHVTGFVLFFLCAWFGTEHIILSAVAALTFSIGMSFGHTFEPWQPLIWRYGAVSAAVASVLCIGGNVTSLDSLLSAEFAFKYLLYAPVGMLTPLGYIVGHIIAAREDVPGKEPFCWSCVGEYWMGAILLGPVPLLRLV